MVDVERILATQGGRQEYSLYDMPVDLIWGYKPEGIIKMERIKMWN